MIDPSIRAKIADVIRADPNFKGAGQEAWLLTDRIVDIPEVQAALRLKPINPMPSRL
jgi:hypothetical protein